jgi:hypothetical protein
MMKDKNDEHAAGASQAYRNVNKTLDSALGIQPNHTRFPSKDFKLHAKRIQYQQKLLNMRDEELKESGQPVRRPRLDKTRNRPLP